MSTISVVTICFNNVDELIKTIQSVDRQTQKPFEHIIIDGSVNTKIKDWAEQTNHPPYRKFKHERDKGIGDAFNKGIVSSSGEIIHLLNSGDEYENENVLMNVNQAFNNHPDKMWASGLLKTLRGGAWVLIGKPFNKNKLYRGMRSVLHPTWFVKKQVYDTIGYYNNDYKIAMDYDFLCRLHNESYFFINKPITVFDPGGISSNRYLDSLKETKKIYEKHFGYSIKLVVWQWRLKILYWLLKSPAGKGLYAIKRKLKLENA